MSALVATQVGRATMVINRRIAGLLSQRDQNALLRVSLGRALWGFIDRDLPGRWDPATARSLGYTGRNRTPYFRTGEMLRNAVRARPVVVATKGRARGLITVPVGHPLRSGEHAAFTRVSPTEARRVAVDMYRAARAILRGLPPPQATGGARGKAALRLRLSQDIALESSLYGGRTNRWAFDVNRDARFEAMGAQLSMARRVAQRGHARGIHLGDAAAPGSTVPALGRAVTQRNANARYRASARGKAVRRAQRLRASARDRAVARARIAANPGQYHPNTLRAYGLN